MTKKINSYANKTLVISVAAAALGVVALTTQNVKADQVAEAPLKTAPNKQPATKIVPAGATNPSTTTNTLEQANNADNEDKPNQPPAAKAPSLPPKKAIKTVNDLVLPKTINWKSADGTDSNITLTLKSANDPDDSDALELDISGGEIKDPKPLAYNGRPSSNGDYSGMLDEWQQFLPLITAIKVTGRLTVNGDASFLFANLNNLKQIDGLNNVDTSQVTDMSYMFMYCPALPSLDLSKFDTSNVTNMSHMFMYCSALPSLDLSSFDTSNVTDMSYMFWYCSALPSLDVSSFDTSQVTSMNQMFSKCDALTRLDLSNFKTPKVTDMTSMFMYDPKLTYLDISNFDTSKVTYMSYMFGFCDDLNTLKLGDNFVTKFPHDPHDDDSFMLLPGPKWHKVGNGTLTHPEDKKGHPVVYFDNFDGSDNFNDSKGKKADTYVRLYLADGITPTRAKDITINYFDQDGNKINLPKSSELSQPYEGLLGGTITPEPEITDANGVKYHLIKDDSRNSKNVTFTDKEQKDIKFYYEKVPSAPNTGSNNSNILGGDVTVHYQDEAGHTLAPDEIIKGHVGAGYVSRTLQIAGYSLKTRPEKATGFFTSDPQSITYVYTLDEAKISKQLMHSAFIYDQNHRRVGESKFHSYEQIMVYPKLVTLADGVQAYKLADNQYVLATNIDGTLRKLKHSAYVYQTVKKRANRLVLSKGKVIRTYGAPYQFKNGKLYYRIGGPKRQYVKVSNFK